MLKTDTSSTMCVCVCVCVRVYWFIFFGPLHVLLVKYFLKWCCFECLFCCYAIVFLQLMSMWPLQNRLSSYIAKSCKNLTSWWQMRWSRKLQAFLVFVNFILITIKCVCHQATVYFYPFFQGKYQWHGIQWQKNCLMALENWEIWMQICNGRTRHTSSSQMNAVLFAHKLNNPFVFKTTPQIFTIDISTTISVYSWKFPNILDIPKACFFFFRHTLSDDLSFPTSYVLLMSMPNLKCYYKLHLFVTY